MPQKQDNWNNILKVLATKPKFNPAAGNSDTSTRKPSFLDRMKGKTEEATIFETNQPSNADEARQLEEYYRSLYSNSRSN